MTARDRAERSPKLRASFAKTVVEVLAEAGPAACEQIQRRLDPQLLERIRLAPRASWLAGEDILAIDAALYDELGEDGLVGFWCRFARRAPRSSLLRPLAEGAMRLLGGPKTAFRLVPRSWTLISRDFGRVECEPEPAERALTVRMLDVPPLSRPDLFRLGQQGSYQGVLELVGTSGRVIPGEFRPEFGRYAYRVTWDE